MTTVQIFPEGISQPLPNTGSWLITDGTPSVKPHKGLKGLCEISADLQQGKWMIIAEEWTYLSLEQLRWMVAMLENQINDGDANVTE
jgi:hypothetical protein